MVTSWSPPPHINVVVSDYGHSLLPRRIPPSCTAIVGSLELNGVVFRRAVEFLRLVASFRSSWSVECDAVDFGGGAAPVQRRPMCMPAAVQLLFTKCKRATAVLDTLRVSITHWLYQQTHRVDVCDALRAVMDVLLFRDDEESEFDYQHSVSSDIRLDIRLLKTASTLTVHPDGTVDLTITLRSGWTPEDAAIVDWGSLEHSLACVPNLSLRFHVLEGEHLFKWFLGGIPAGNLLPKLSGRGQLYVRYEPMYVTLEELVQKSMKTAAHSASGHVTSPSPVQAFELLRMQTREPKLQPDISV